MHGHILDIYVYGGAGGLFAEFFNAIAAATGSGTFSTLLRISALLAGTTALASAIFRRDFLICVRWFAGFYLVFYILFLPKVDVQIIDRIDKRGYSVDNVPLGLGVLASLTTSIGHSLTTLTDQVFTMPGDLAYNKTGMVMASKLALASRQFQITDPRLNENMERFMVQCVYWPILLGYYTMEDLVTAQDLWGFIKDHAPKSRSFLYDGRTSTGDAGLIGKRSLVICKDCVAQLGADLQANMDQIAARGAARIFTGSNKTGSGLLKSSSTPTDVKAQLLKYLPVAYGYLLNTADTATNILQQSVVANAVTNGLLYFNISTNSQTGVANYAATKAQEQQRLTQNTLGFLASYWLPIMKSAFEAIMYGCFLFILPLGLFPFGLSVLKNYVYTLCWLQAWAPLYAIINLICSYYAQVQSSAFPGGFVLKNWYSFLQVNHDMASLAGYLTLSVPFIAAGLVKGMASTMTHVAQYMGGVSQSVGSQAAAEAVAGNISMGVTSMRNNSAFNFSAHQQDLTARMASGANYQLPSGDSINFMPDGGVAVSRGRTISDLGMNIDFNSSIQNAATQQADYAYNTAKSESIAAGESYQAGMRSLYELSDHAGSSKSSGETWVVSDNASVVQALNKTKDLTQQFADEHQISYDHAKEVLTAAHGKITGSLTGRVSAGTPSGGGATASSTTDGNSGSAVGVNAKTPGIVSAKAGLDIGVSGGVDWTTQHKGSEVDRRILSSAESFVKKSGYSENIDVVSRAAIDRSLHSTNEKGARLVDTMGSSFDRSNNLRKEAETHYQEAASYRSGASHSQESGIQSRVNINQEFLNYAAKQPSIYGKGTMGVTNVLGMMSRDPEYAKMMVDGFSRELAKSHLFTWNTSAPHSQQGIKDISQKNVDAMTNQGMEALQKQQTNDKAAIKAPAEQKELTNEKLVDTSIKDLAESKFETNKQALQQGKDQLNNAELAKEQKFKETQAYEKQERSYGILHDAVGRRDKTRKTVSNKLDDKND